MDSEKEVLLEYIELISPISEELKKYLSDTFVVKSYDKGEIILNLGKTSKFIAFVIQGVACASYQDNNGNWKAARFMKEQNVIASMLSFITQTPAKEEIVALEKTIVCGIPHSTLYKLYDIYPEVNKIGRLILEKYLQESEVRSIILRNDSAKARVLLFNEFQSDLMQRISQKHIASFLGITQETLSRIQSSKIKNKPNNQD
jgi:CRP-like cAMP-binding protein